MPPFNLTTEYIDFVPRDYRADPETDTVFYTSHQLRDGMVILAEEPGRWFYDFSKETTISQKNLDLFLKMNRWCQISEVVFTRRGRVVEQVNFTATYADGVVVERANGVNKPWLVKTRSIPVALTPKRVIRGEIDREAMVPEQYQGPLNQHAALFPTMAERVRETVLDGLNEEARRGRTHPFDRSRHADEITAKIMKIVKGK